MNLLLFEEKARLYGVTSVHVKYLAVLAASGGIERETDEPAVIGLIDAYSKKAPLLLFEFEIAIDKKDFTRAKVDVQQLELGSARIGARRLVELCRQASTAAEMSPQQTSDILEELLIELCMVLRDLEVLSVEIKSFFAPH